VLRMGMHPNQMILIMLLTMEDNPPKHRRAVL
jgi:hypothetical protein